MAGAGYKLFATGDVLTAAQVNTYLMQQTVMVFASSAARTTALSGVLAEGMVSYLQDSNTLEVYDGSAWVGATGDITGLTAGTGISISSATGPVPTVTNSMATEITAKGDLIVGTGSGTFDNLAAGSNGDTIVADSSTSTGLRYQVPVNVNPVLNSAFQIGQRGTSFNNVQYATTYTLDRWCYYTNAAAADYTISRQATGDTTNLPNIQYAMRVQRNSGKTGTSALSMTQSIETINAIPYAGKTVTVSFYARKGANFSETASRINFLLESGTGTDQNVLSGFTGQTTVNATTLFTLTTTWQRFSVTGTIAATATELALTHYYTPTGTAGAADYYDITGIQIEIGSVATPFKTNGATFQGELAAASRYYQVLASGTQKFLAPASVYTAGQLDILITYPEMRIAPSLVATSGTGYFNFIRNGGSDVFNSITLNGYTTPRGAALYNNTEISSTAGNAGWVYLDNASASVALNAEL